MDPGSGSGNDTDQGGSGSGSETLKGTPCSFSHFLQFLSKACAGGPPLTQRLGKKKYNEHGNYSLARMLDPQAALRIPDVVHDSVIGVALCGYVNAALAKASWEKYSSGWRAFCNFEEHTQVSSAWPLSREVIRSFAIWCLRDRQLKAASVRTYLSGLKLIHTLKGFPDAPNLKDGLLDLILTGAGKMALSSPTPSTRRVVTLPMLRLLGHRIATSPWAPESKLMVWAALTAGFFSSARLGELLAKQEARYDPTTDLLWGQVQFRKGHEGPSVLMHIRIPKSATVGGRYLDLFPFPDPSCCAVEAMQGLHTVHSRLGLIDPALPVFRFASGMNLTPAKLNGILQDLLSDIFEPGVDSVSCHSLRAGIPSAISRFPDLFSDDEIKETGGWLSDAMHLYTRLPESRKRATHKKIVHVLSKM